MATREPDFGDYFRLRALSTLQMSDIPPFTHATTKRLTGSRPLRLQHKKNGTRGESNEDENAKICGGESGQRSTMLYALHLHCLRPPRTPFLPRLHASIVQNTESK